MSKGRNYIYSLDVVRFLLILAVILYHYMPHRFSGGFLGVNGFFILSGLLVTRGLEKAYQKGQGQSYFKTLLNRWWKLFLPLLVMIVIVVSYMTFFAPNFTVNLGPTVLSSLTFTNNIYQNVANYSYFDDFFNPNALTHLWYISVQMQYYLIWPLLFWLIRKNAKTKKKSGYWILALTALSFLSMAILYQPDQVSQVYYGTYTRFFSFGLGAVVAQLMNIDKILESSIRSQASKKLKGVTVSYLTLTMLALGLMIWRVVDISPWTYRMWMIVFDLVLIVFLIGLLAYYSNRPLPKWLNPLKNLGQLTYYVYLWYYPIFMIFFKASSQSSWFNQSIWAQIALIYIMAWLTSWITKKIPLLWQDVKDFLKIKEPMSTQTLFALAATTILLSTSIYGVSTASSAENITVEEMQARQAAEDAKRQEELGAQMAAENNQLTALEIAMAEYLDKGLSQEEIKFANNLQASFIGDSLLLGAESELDKLYPKAYVDGAVGRQAYQSFPVFTAIEEAGNMHDPVIIILGTNGVMAEKDMNQIYDFLGTRDIFVVAPKVNRVWEAEVNHVYRASEESYGNVHVIDWKSLADDHPDWMEEDGAHLTRDGYQALVIKITHELYNFYY